MNHDTPGTKPENSSTRPNTAAPSLAPAPPNQAATHQAAGTRPHNSVLTFSDSLFELLDTVPSIRDSLLALIDYWIAAIREKQQEIDV